MNKTTTPLDVLYDSYLKFRNITLNKNQFIHLLKVYPALIILMSDGVVDKEERLVLSVQASKLGYRLASDDLGMEKEENLMLIYKAEFKYLIKNRHLWECKFLDTLKEYLQDNHKEKAIIKETMQLFASASQGTSKEESHAMDLLREYLDLDS